jgi:S1-C subfamily serine protease
MKRIVLKHLSGSKASQVEEFPLNHFQELVIGRDPSAAVKYDPTKDDLVGRRHARIAPDPTDPSQFTITDLNSRNGTFVNRQRIIGSARLKPGDVVQLGPGGPELMFDLDPRPENFVAATREANVFGGVDLSTRRTMPLTSGAATREANVSGGVDSDYLAPTRETPRETAAQTPGSGVVISPPPLFNRAQASQASNEALNPNSAVQRGIGKATLERVIAQTKSESRKMLFASTGALVLVVALLAGGIAWWSYNKFTKVESGHSTLQGEIESVKNRPEPMKPAEISEKYSNAVAQIHFAWSLIYTPTGEKLYHQFVPNLYRAADGAPRPLLEGGPRMLPAFVLLEGGSVEPVLGTRETQLPIASAGSGTGFVVHKDGLLITNRHVAASWRARYFYKPGTFPAVLLRPDGQPVMGNNDLPVIVRSQDELPPWTPSETRQTFRGIIGRPQIEGRNEYLNVVFARTKQPFKATLASVSEQHDVATIKVIVGTDLPVVTLNDNYDTIKVGDAICVLGFPVASPDPVFTLGQKDWLTGSGNVGTIPDPTLTTGRITKLIRGQEGIGEKKLYSVGDVYQLDIVATGGGNSGGPVFDEQGRVIGIYYATSRSDALMSFAVPIRYARELMGPVQVLK